MRPQALASFGNSKPGSKHQCRQQYMTLRQRNSQIVRRSREQGFILPLTLWVIAAIGLAVVAVNTWVSQAVENARVLKEQADRELAIANIRNELVFAIGARPVTYRGLEVGRQLDKVDRNDATAMMAAEYRSDRFIKFDGRPYLLESEPDYVLRIYDSRGLLNLNAIAAPNVRRMLGLFNVSEADRNQLVDALEDYVDRDDLTRVSGAEDRDYTRLGLSPAANAWLVTPYEAQYVMGWDRLSELWKRDLQTPLMTTCMGTGLNPNTAGREVLISSINGLMEENVATILERREKRPFRNAREFAAASQSLVREEPFFFTFAPGQCLIVEITHQPSHTRTRFSLTIESFNVKTKPWQVDYAFRIPSEPTPLDREPAPEEVFPAPVTLDAIQHADTEIGGTRPPGALDPQPLDDSP
ncbi:MAG: hypothetical protein EXR11_09630 [Rhodospirillaceae bacterium]|nr:hypothetical protein [Rhodospirillaceae bacterium]